MLMLMCVAIISFSACSEDEEISFSINKRHYTLKPNKTTNIDGVGLSNISWKSSNEFVATAVDGEIKSEYVGNCTLLYEHEHFVLTVSVEPQYTLYTEPKLSWGASLSKIKAENGTPYYVSSNLLIYKSGNSVAPYNVYYFESGCLSSVGVIVNMNYYQQLVNFLTERYMVTSLNYSNIIATFAHMCGKKSQPQIDYVVGLGYESTFNGILVGYSQSSSTKSVSSNNEFNDMLKCLENLD